MNREEVIDKVCDRVMMVIYNELDYYMFEELGFMETNDEYVEEISKLAYDVVDYLSENL